MRPTESAANGPGVRTPFAIHALWRLFRAGNLQVGIIDVWKTAPEQRGILHYDKKKGSGQLHSMLHYALPTGLVSPTR